MKITVNSDTEVVNKIRQKLKENDGYCPCRLTKTLETKCMCKEFIESTEKGLCHCGLYEKVDK